MEFVRIVSVGAAVFLTVSPAAFAEQAHTGTITEINRLNNTIAIRPTQDGTVGANANGPSDQFKAGSGVSMDAWHAGDRVSYSASGNEGAKTITKIERVRPGVQQ